MGVWWWGERPRHLWQRTLILTMARRGATPHDTLRRNRWDALCRGGKRKPMPSRLVQGSAGIVAFILAQRCRIWRGKRRLHQGAR